MSPGCGGSDPGWSLERKEGRGSQTGPSRASPETQTEALVGTEVLRWHLSQVQTRWEGEKAEGTQSDQRGEQRGQTPTRKGGTGPGGLQARPGPKTPPVTPRVRSQQGACPGPPVCPASPLRLPRGSSAPRLNSASPSSRAAVRRDSANPDEHREFIAAVHTSPERRPAWRMAVTHTSNTASRAATCPPPQPPTPGNFEVTAAPPSLDCTRARARPPRASLRGFLFLTRHHDNRLSSGSECRQLPEQPVGPRSQPSTAS